GYDRAGMRKVNAGQFQLFALDILPDSHPGPVRDREGAKILTLVRTSVIEIPQLGALILGIPLAEAITETHDALLGTGLFFVAPRAANAAIETEFLDGFQ